MDWPDIAEKIITGSVVSAVFLLGGWIGKKIGWVYAVTDKNRKDLNAAFKKIRHLEKECLDDGITREHTNYGSEG